MPNQNSMQLLILGTQYYQALDGLCFFRVGENTRNL